MNRKRFSLINWIKKCPIDGIFVDDLVQLLNKETSYVLPYKNLLMIDSCSGFFRKIIRVIQGHFDLSFDGL